MLADDSIHSCSGLPTTYWKAGNEPCPEDVGTDAAYWATQGCFATEPGNMVGPTRLGIEELIASDPNAVWVGDGPTGCVDNSIHGEDWLKSQRIVPIGVIDIDWFMSQDPSGSNGVLRLVDIFGFFIEGMGMSTRRQFDIVLQRERQGSGRSRSDHPRHGHGTAAQQRDVPAIDHSRSVRLR